MLTSKLQHFLYIYINKYYIVIVICMLIRLNQHNSLQGLKDTLQTLDKEMPRADDSISNRQVLMRELHLDKLMKKNKVIFFVTS